MPIFCKGKCPVEVEQPVLVGGDVVIDDSVVDAVSNGVLDPAVDGVIGAAEDDDVVSEVVEGLIWTPGQLLLQ